MTFRSIARGAAVASSVVLLSGYVWYRSGAGVQHSEAQPHARAAQVAAATDAGGAIDDVNRAEYVSESSDPGISLMEVFPGSKSAPMDLGPQPKAGYVFAVKPGRNGGSIDDFVVEDSVETPPATAVDRTFFGGSKSGEVRLSPPPPVPPEQKRTMLLSGSKSERAPLLLPPSTEDAAPAKPEPPAPKAEKRRTTLLSGSKSERAVILHPSAAGEAAPAAPEPTKKRRVLMSSSKSKPVTWVEVDDETDAPPAPQEQRREQESRP